MWPLSACRSASANKISPKSDNRSMSYGQKSDFQDGVRHRLEFQNSIFGHVTVTGFNIWCSVLNFIKIGRFFTEIWRFNDFQNWRPPSWILKICSFCHIFLVDMPFCFLIQNFGGRRRLEFQKSRDCHWVQYLLQCTKFYQNRMIFHWDMVI